MLTSPPLALPPSRSAAVAVTVALHLALIWVWQFARAPRPPVLDAETVVPIEWLALPRPPVQQPEPARQPAPIARPAAPPPIMHAAPPDAPSAPAPLPAPPTPRAEDILRQARRDVGKIDRDLRKESPSQLRAPADTALSRLATGIEAATARPRPWQAPRIDNVMDQGGYDRRIYKVTSANGVYCVYYESNHAPDGLDSVKTGIRPKIMTCPREK